MEQQNQEKQTGPDTKKKGVFRTYLPMALTVLGIIIISIIVFFLIYRYQGTGNGIKNIINALQSIIFGCVIAYLINPLVKYMEKKELKKHREKKGDLNDRARRRIRISSIAVGMVVFLAIIVAIFLLIIPQVVNGIQDFVQNVNENVVNLQNWARSMTTQNPELAEQITKYSNQTIDYIKNWLNEKLLANGNLVRSITSSIYTIIRTLFNLLLGLVVAIYILMKKEVFKGLIKKIVYAIFKPRVGNYVMEVLRKTDDVFGGFFIGDIVDSLIIGILCFLGLVVMQIPYAGLIGLIVGVTNLIPVFGPYFGAIPSAILIVMVDPWKALIFLIFILILQQFDGNILKPRILGDTLGLSPFWIVFAIVLFGGLFGIMGFFVGVPMFAVVYYVIKRLVEYRLHRQHLPEETRDYVNVQRIDVSGDEIRIREGESKDRQILQFGKRARKESREQKKKNDESEESK